MKKLKKLKALFIKNKLLFGILILATLLRFVGLFPNITHADEGFVQVYSWDLVRNIITDGDFNPHTFKYGSLMFYLQALGYFPILAASYLFEVANILISSNFTSQPLDFSIFHSEAVRRYDDLLVIVGRSETAIFGVASVFLIYLIVKKLFSERVALFSALFLGVAPLHIRDSHYITTDVLSVFTVLLSLLFLIYMYQTKKLKWFILSGLALGVSLTIRYYPIAFLVYPLAVLFSFSKEKIWFLKVFISVIAVLFGVFLGLPYLFLDPQGPALLIKDLEKYALPWYSTAISSFGLSIFTAIFSGGEVAIPDVSTLYPRPESFRPVHATWIFFNGFGPLLTLASLAGLVTMLFTSVRKFSFRHFLLLSIIPLANFIYISFYVPATYERLVIPTLPFLAIFAAIFIDFTYKFLANRFNAKNLIRVIVIIVALIILPPLVKASSANLACSQKRVQDQSYSWVDKNITDEAKIGYLTMVTVPPKNFGQWFALEPGQKISMEEARGENLDHAFVNAGRLDYNTYPYFNDFFITPAKLYENSYYFLVLSEYRSRAKLLGEVEKPWMCDVSRIYYYKLPQSLEERTNRIGGSNFDNLSDLNAWHIKSYDLTGKSTTVLNTQIGKNSKGSLEYNQGPYRYTPPRIALRNLPIKGERVYTFSAWAKGYGETPEASPSLVLRVDFYETAKGRMEKFKNDLMEAILLIGEGPTPMFFEKKYNLKKVFTNTDSPGKTVALSSLTKLDGNWQKLTVTVKAPKETSFAVLALQPISLGKMILYIDDVEFLGD